MKLQFSVGNENKSVGSLLSTRVVKTAKGEKYGYYTAVLYLNANLAPSSICPSHTKDCLASCLKGSGQLGMKRGANAVTVRTEYLLHHKEAFLFQLKKEIRMLVKKAQNRNLIPTLRLNGSSDIAWESKKYGEIIQWAMSQFPDLIVYDYTKIVGRALPEYRSKLGISNYHITFSWSGENETQCKIMLSKGVNVAVPFDTRSELPETFLSTKVIDGDLSDLRFLDTPGSIVGLRYKRSYDKPEKGRKLVKRLGFIVPMPSLERSKQTQVA